MMGPLGQWERVPLQRRIHKPCSRQYRPGAHTLCRRTGITRWRTAFPQIRHASLCSNRRWLNAGSLCERYRVYGTRRSPEVALGNLENVILQVWLTRVEQPPFQLTASVGGIDIR